MQPASEPKKNTAVIGIFAIVILAALVVGTIALKPSDSNNASPTGNSGGSTANSSTPATDDAGTNYKDGTYQASGSYSSPGGNESIAVTITITNNQVSDSSVTPKAATRESSEYQDDFVAGYQEQVVGKALAELQLSNVSGSSLTSRGFNNALTQIRNQARI